MPSQLDTFPVDSILEMLEKILRGVEKKRSTCRGFELFPKAATLVRKVEKLPGGACQLVQALPYS